MLKKLLFCLTLIPYYLQAQDSTALRFAQYISVPELKKHLTYIASDELAGRRTGTVGQKKAAQYIAKHFESQGLMPIVKDSLKGNSFIQPFYIKRYFLEQYSVIHSTKTQHTKGRGVIPTENVLGFIEGTDRKDEVIVITAHYDHLGGMGPNTYFPGANDNASGVAMLLDLAKHYAKHPAKYSIAFIAFAAEEAGLLGSKYFTENPLIPLENIRFLWNLDLLGNGDAGATVVNATIHPKAFALLNNINHQQKYLTKITARGKAANSDHYFFSEKGVPAFFLYTQGGSSAYHDVDDMAKNLPLTAYENLFKLFIDFNKAIMP